MIDIRTGILSLYPSPFKQNLDAQRTMHTGKDQPTYAMSAYSRAPPCYHMCSDRPFMRKGRAKATKFLEISQSQRVHRVQARSSQVV